jgi:peptidase E
VPTAARQVFAFSGVLDAEPGQPGSFRLVEHALSLAADGGGGRGGRTRVCYVPTAIGDAQADIDTYEARFAGGPGPLLTALRLFPQPSVPDVREHLLAQDVILVEGGSVVNLMAVWRAHGLPQIMRECWENGVVMAGASAGSLCWHVGGPTDSFRDTLDPFTDGLGFLGYSNGVHDDFGGQPRRQVYRDLVARRVLPAGYASEDGVGLHYVGGELHEAVSIRAGKRAWWVQPDGDDRHAEQPVAARRI